jgi:hypothetical protein
VMTASDYYRVIARIGHFASFLNFSCCLIVDLAAAEVKLLGEGSPLVY